MCGIAGVLALKGALGPGSGEALKGAIAYRGLDAEGEWTDGRRVRLLHSRLKVIDLSTGDQPMVDAGGRFVTVANGEIYNYSELRAEYEALGARHRTRSDTEIILSGCRVRGERFLHDLNGMFAFAVWDGEERSLLLARDRLGKKPLFWTVLRGMFYFASSLDAFRGLEGWTGELSRAAVEFYGMFGSFPAERTIYREAFSLPPGSCMTVRPGQGAFAPRRYWRMNFAEKARVSLREALEEYETLLVGAVDIRLRSDVPVALAFSGGVDSGSIAAVAAGRLGRSLACHTVDYHTAEDRSEETRIARAVAGHLGLDWHYVHFDYHTELLEGLGDAYRHYDQPCRQLALVYSSRLFHAMKRSATVVLSGNGADELFTGYVGDERVRARDFALGAPAPARRIASMFLRNPYLREEVPDAWMHKAAGRLSGSALDAAGRDEVLEWIGQTGALMRECGVSTMVDMRMMLSLMFDAADANFRIPDISGLEAQVEVRSPYLDYRLVEFAARLPHRHKVRFSLTGARTKYLPKKYYGRHVPRAVAWSPKKGMGYNLRWHLSVARDRRYREEFERAYGALETAGFDAEGYRRSWRGYIGDIEAGREFSAHGERMMAGFMLGRWLQREG